MLEPTNENKNAALCFGFKKLCFCVL